MIDGGRGGGDWLNIATRFNNWKENQFFSHRKSSPRHEAGEEALKAEPDVQMADGEGQGAEVLRQLEKKNSIQFNSLFHFTQGNTILAVYQVIYIIYIII